MATPAFGFSVGDFIAGIKLIKDLIDSLDEAAGAGPAYCRLAAELRSLERALTKVKSLRIHPSQAAQKIALERVASQCRDCIDTFLWENTKFSNTLGALTTVSEWCTDLCNVQWADCTPDAVNNFGAEITGHVLNCTTLVAVIQLTSTTVQADLAENEQDVTKQHHHEDIDVQSIARANNDVTLTQPAPIFTILNRAAYSATLQRILDLGKAEGKLFEISMNAHQLILGIQSAIKHPLPIPIHRQQPVYFEDAHGRIAPLHLEFINSWEAFEAVLSVRFRNVPGLEKVQRREYILHDSQSKMGIDFETPWKGAFLPGQQVVMSMMFHTTWSSTSSRSGSSRRESNDSAFTDENVFDAFIYNIRHVHLIQEWVEDEIMV